MPIIKQIFPVLCCLALSACDSPSIAFMGAFNTVVMIENSTFSVHRREDKVEVYRTSFEMLPPREQVLQRAKLAIMQATGCEVKNGSLQGDQALIKASLACQGQPETPPIPAHLRYECDIIDGWDMATSTAVIDAIECVLVPI